MKKNIDTIVMIIGLVIASVVVINSVKEFF